MKSENPLSQKIKTFLIRYYKDNIFDIFNLYPQKKSLFINFNYLEIFDKELSQNLIENPDVIISLLESEIKNIETPFKKTINIIHARIVNFPYRISIRDIRSKHLSKFISIEGLIRKATEVRPKIQKAAFKCLKCSTITIVEQSSHKIEEPYNGCKNELCGRKGPFKTLVEKSEFVDSQKGQIQESPESLKGGSNPQSIEINLSDDIAGTISPGDRVIINGTLQAIQKSIKDGKSLYYDLTIDANSIEHLDKEYDELDISTEDENEIKKLSEEKNIYEKIINSIAPTIFGSTTIKNVKEALMLQLFSGISKILPDGSRIRGDIHIMLVGDPGVAKSQLLRYIIRLSPRGVFTSGKSTSASGLTAAAVKDDIGDGRWTIEGGALVMADRGIAAVDEMDKMRDEDKSALHEAMEQQTISIAKAGIIATLKSRCSLLGAANPIYGRFNRYESISDQIDMPPTLLSRFDLIFVILDIPENQQDKKIASHIIQTHYAGELLQNKNNVINSKITQESIDENMSSINPEINPELMRKYVAYAKKNIYPIMTKEARDYLIDFYTTLRKLGEGKDTPVPSTARQLEALVRIAEASARVELRNVITLEDAERTTRITIECLKQVGIDPTTGALDVDIISSGISKTQRDKITVIKEILKYLREKSDVMNLEEIYIEAEKKDIDREEAEQILNKMSRKGDIIRPSLNQVKLL